MHVVLCNCCRIPEFGGESGHQAVSNDGLPCLAFQPSSTLKHSSWLALTDHRKDRLPDLADLKRIADDGCRFCSRLSRCAILERSDETDYSGDVTITL